MNPDTTPTPRTDSIISAIDMDQAFQDLCRQLEIENARLREELDRLKRGCQGSCYACEPVGEMNLKLEAEVARLRELLEKVLNELEKVPFHTPKLTAFTAHRLTDRYREQLNQLTTEKLHNQ